MKIKIITLNLWLLLKDILVQSTMSLHTCAYTLLKEHMWPILSIHRFFYEPCWHSIWWMQYHWCFSALLPLLWQYHFSSDLHCTVLPSCPMLVPDVCSVHPWNKSYYWSLNYQHPSKQHLKDVTDHTEIHNNWPYLFQSS